jgi:PAS domain S-box-containing protein
MRNEAPAPAPDELLQLLAAQAGKIAALKVELAECRDQVRAIIENNPRPAWVYSRQSLRFLAVNHVATAVYGWSRDEFLGMTIADIRPPEDVPALLANVARVGCRPGGITAPWRHRHKDGTVVEMVISYCSLSFGGHSARLIVANPATAPRYVSTRSSALAQLSRREREVFDRVARGHTSREIAGELGLSPKSVETYRARFMSKLSLKTRAEIVQFAVDQGVLVG